MEQTCICPDRKAERERIGVDLNKRFICLETKGMKTGCRDARRERETED